jgi:hypothetical protein
LFIENGNSDVALLSSENIADGRWHQIAASWSSAGVFLFIDGIQTDQDTQTKELKESTARGRDVRFGKPSDDLIARNLISYAGWVDEIALWNRPLTLTEVNKQFESAKGEVQR